MLPLPSLRFPCVDYWRAVPLGDDGIPIRRAITNLPKFATQDREVMKKEGIDYKGYLDAGPSILTVDGPERIAFKFN